ncbi:hypothetical protein KKF84_16840, partial [Myxococcota bacterium]|nr:hypothetical protein [Myxococcota bacterium]
MKKFTIPLVGAILGIIGVVLPWMTVSVGRVSRSVSGYDSKHGLLFIGALAVVAIICGIMRAQNSENSIVGGVIAVAGIGLAIMAYNDLQNVREGVRVVKSFMGGRGMKVEVGIGLWTVLTGVGIVALGAIFDLIRANQYQSDGFLD